MKFEWDEAKNKINIRKHGIDFNDVVEIFQHPIISYIDKRDNYGEERWISIGQIQRLTIVIVYVEYKNDTIRIISARKASKHEKKYYEEKFIR